MGDRHQQNPSTGSGTGVNYTLDLNTGLTQVLSDGTNTYLYGNGRISQFSIDNSQLPEYFLSDALGSVRQLADTNSAVTLTQSYAPYGEVTQSVGTSQTSYAFTGENLDANGVTFLRARYYAPQDGRFISRDTWDGKYERPLSLNRWGYVEGNPVNFTDPTGHYAYNRMKAANYAISWDQSSTSNLDPQYDFTGSDCFIDASGKPSDFSNQCTIFASFVLYHGGVRDTRSTYGGIPYWDINALANSSKSTQCYSALTAIHTPTFYDFVIKNVGNVVLAHNNPPHYNENRPYNSENIDQTWEDKLSANRGQIQPGDLVFYDTNGAEKWDHVAVIVGWGMPTTFGTEYFDIKDTNNPESILQWVYSFTCSPDENSLPTLRPAVVDRSGAIKYQYWRSLDNTSEQVKEIQVVHVR